MVAGLLAGCADAPTVPRAAPDARPVSAPALAIPPGPYVPGQSYFGRNGYVEYLAGNAPLILSVPHGGNLIPAEIPDRTAAACGGAADRATDSYARELARAMQQRYFARFGTYPHVVLVHLRRTKLDANRPILEAACGDAEAEIAFHEWHDFIATAKAAVLATTGKGWYMDVHGHTHAVDRLELGYLLDAKRLALSDATLDATVAYEDTASMRTMSVYSPSSFSALLRGSKSLGTLYAENGFPAVPSASDPSPGTTEFFSGGYNTERHACGAEAALHGGTPGGDICGVQLEANYVGVRDTPANRERFADVTVTVLEEYLWLHWGLRLGVAPPPPPPNTPPTAGFQSACSGLTCSFTDTSTDVDGTIVARQWSFGDGAASMAANPSRTYAAGGTYTVALTVTDDDGATGQATATVTVAEPAAMALSTRGYKVKGKGYVDLTWQGASGTSVDVYRNGVRRTTTANDGAYTDALERQRGTFTYRVCDAGTGACSNPSSVTF